MKAKIFSFTVITETSMIASARISRFIRDRYAIPITRGDDIAEEPLDLLIIMNGAYAFSAHLASLGSAILAAKRVVWLQNDYTIIPPKNEGDAQSPFRKAHIIRKDKGLPDVDFWTTCEKWQAKTPGSRYINWNCLTFQEKDFVRSSTRNDNVLYYGSYRIDRKKDFERFFSEPKVPTTIASPAKQFAEKFPNCVHDGKIDTSLHSYLTKFGAGLYLEDRKSHSEFHSPANRFYEMLSAGLPILFQSECGSMMRRAGYDPTPFYVANTREVARAMDRREVIGKEQSMIWYNKAKAEIVKLRTDLDEAMKSVKP